MSSSDETRPMQAIPWALDELEMPDIFLMPSNDVLFHAHVEHHTEQTPHSETDTHERVDAAAYARGHADAVRSTRAEHDASLTSALAALADALDTVRLHEARWTANAEENLAALAVVVAQHIVEREVTIDPTIVRDLVRRALAEFPLDQVIIVRLHPDDITTCGGMLTPDAAGRMQDVRWIADPTLHRGGCLVEGRERVIDGRVDTSLERAYRSIGQIQA